MMTGRWRIAAILAMAGSFSILTFLVWNGDTINFDIALRNWALGFNNAISVTVWEDISLMGSVAVISTLTFLSLGLFVVRSDWGAARQLALAMCGAVGFDISTKWIVHRPRPDEVYAHTMPTTYSFPSGHALYGFVFYLTIAAIVTRRSLGNGIWGVWGSAITIAILIGVSRIFLGVHYGSDVLGGYLIAAIWLIILWTPTDTDKPRSVSQD